MSDFKAAFAASFDDADRRALIDNTAQDVFVILTGLSNESSLHASRWVWELLQNARDARPPNGSVHVSVELTHDFVAFRHNGAPFTKDQVAHLIRHGSTKYQHEGQVGRFGTGFLSTHIISKAPRVSGLLDDGQRFQFVLDRTGESPAALTESMNRSVAAFLASVDIASDHETHTTEYLYPLEPGCVALAVEGVASLVQFAPYVLTFNPQLEAIDIKVHGEQHTYRRGPAKSIAERCRIVPVWVRGGTAKTISYRLLTASAHEVTVAVMAKRIGGRTVVQFDASVPRFFMAFPMFGTEGFGFSGVVNSESFRPKPERNGLYLGTDTTDDNKRNKALLEAASALLLETLERCTRRGWQGVDVLCRIGSPRIERGLDHDWLKELTVEKLVTPLRDLKLVPVLDGSLAAARQSWIPVASGTVSDSEVWRLASALSKADVALVEKSCLESWVKNLQEWSDVLATSPDEMVEAVTLRKLAGLTAQAESLSGLGRMLREPNSASAWLDGLLGLLHMASQSFLLDQLGLLPDQLGTLRVRKEVSIDGGVDEELKAVADLLGEPLRAHLLHPDLHCPDVHKVLSTKTTADAIKDLLNKLHSEAKKVDPVPAYREANARLFAWLVKQGRLDLLTSFPAMTQENAVEGQPLSSLLLRKQEEPDLVPLAPPEVWHEGARAFKELFPPRLILASDYQARLMQPEPWIELGTKGFVRPTPIVSRTKLISAFVPDESMKEEEEHISNETHVTTDIAFLRSERGGLIDAARKSRQRSLLLLRFLMLHVVPTDHGWHETEEAACRCGNTHRFAKASWLEDLQTRKWIAGDRNRSEAPSATSLSKLVVDDDEVIQLLASGHGPEFLSALGVSAGDFLIQSVTGDEPTRVSLSRSLVEMFRAVGQDASQIHDLAKEIASHPETINEIKERQLFRERVKRNQLVGRSVEQAFEAAFASGQGLVVNRSPVGMDYTVEPENDYLDESGQEVILEVGKFLVEIKATFVGHVRMTDVQARKAASEPDRYVLCVVPLSPDVEPIDASVIVQRAKFVSNIGRQVQDLVDTMESVEATKRSLIEERGPIGVELRGETVRYRISEAVWKSADEFAAAVALFGGSTVE